MDSRSEWCRVGALGDRDRHEHYVRERDAARARAEQPRVARMEQHRTLRYSTPRVGWGLTKGLRRFLLAYHYTHPHPSRTAIAQACGGVSARTVRRWMASDPAFQARCLAASEKGAAHRAHRDAVAGQRAMRARRRGWMAHTLVDQIEAAWREERTWEWQLDISRGRVNGVSVPGRARLSALLAEMASADIAHCARSYACHGERTGERQAMVEAARRVVAEDAEVSAVVAAAFDQERRAAALAVECVDAMRSARVLAAGKELSNAAWRDVYTRCLAAVREQDGMLAAAERVLLEALAAEHHGANGRRFKRVRRVAAFLEAVDPEHLAPAYRRGGWTAAMDALHEWHGGSLALV